MQRLNLNHKCIWGMTARGLSVSNFYPIVDMLRLGSALRL